MKSTETNSIDECEVKRSSKKVSIVRSLILLVFLAIGTIPALAQDTNPDYDPELAAELGADEYGMRWYVLAILKTGETRIEDAAELRGIFAGHMQNIQRLAAEGKLIVAGPLAVNELTYRGIVILNTGEIEEAWEMLRTDPVIESGVMDAEVLRWYGSAALAAYLETHKKIEKSRF